MKRFLTGILAAALLAVSLALAADPARRRDPRWSEVRASVLKEHPDCQACGRRAEVVHHIIPVHVSPGLELERANLIPMCERCHLLVGHLNSFRSWNTNVVNDSRFWLERIRSRPARKTEPLPGR